MSFTVGLFLLLLFFSAFSLLLLVSMFIVKEGEHIQYVLLRICGIYFLINIIFVVSWILGALAGNWHRKNSETFLNKKLLRKLKISRNLFFIQLLGDINKSIWNSQELVNNEHL
jgi:hypothetical protein